MNSLTNGTSGAEMVPLMTFNAQDCLKSCDIEEVKNDTYEPKIQKIFSKNILKQKIKEYKAGKYTKQYINIFLDFNHLEGVINNLDYIEFKNSLKD